MFTRQMSSAYKNAAHAVETTQALRGLGFKQHEINAAMEKTRTHVGATDLTLDQWVRIALGYCSRPTS